MLQYLRFGIRLLWKAPNVTLSGSAARCAEAAVPFREGCVFILGYAPALRDRVATCDSNFDNFYRAKLWGRSPDKNSSSLRKGTAASAHRAAKPRRIVLEDLSMRQFSSEDLCKPYGRTCATAREC